MKNIETQILRVVAILLVINSHLDAYYPIPHLGTGGAIGNSLFFFLSGYGLYISQGMHHKKFNDWIAHRITRIYPSMWIVILAVLLPAMIYQQAFDVNKISEYISYFLSPPYWFLRALLLYYVLCFPLLENKAMGKIYIVMAVLAVIYFVCYYSYLDISKWSAETQPFCMIQYLIIYVFGIWMGMSQNQHSRYSYRHIIILMVVIFMFYLQKYYMLHGKYYEIQFMQHLAMFPIVYCLLVISRGLLIDKNIKLPSVFYKTINFIADHTLEIYIVQESIGDLIKDMRIQFPVNICVFIAVTITLAWAAKKIAARILECLNHSKVLAAAQKKSGVANG